MFTHKAVRKPALQQNWQSSEKSQNSKEKTQYFMNTLYIVTKNLELYVLHLPDLLLGTPMKADQDILTDFTTR